MTWLITGGAGYIGAHVVEAMQAANENVVVIDDLSSGQAHRITETPLIIGSILNEDLVRTVIRDYAVENIIHLAGKKQVAESVADPMLYYRENVGGLRVLLDVGIAAGLRNLVYSSSAAVYGAVGSEMVSERASCQPTNPYGQTKLVGEWMIRSAALASGFRYANLRYFNVAGAMRPALADTSLTNLFPMVFDRLAVGLPPLIFGGDYPTPDGSCVRDYIHVSDIASAHVAAAQALSAGKKTAITVNVGRGEGLSVRQIIEAMRTVTGAAADPATSPITVAARPGDPPSVVAAASAIHDELGWQSRHDITDMIASAWAGWRACVSTA